MKLIFFHDHIITPKQESLYSTGGLNSIVIARYLKLSNFFSIGSRINSSRKIKNLTRIADLSEVNFIPIPNLASLNFFNYIKAYKIISKLIDENEFVIIRLPSLIGFMATFISRRKRKKHLVELVGCPWDSYFNYSITGMFIAGPLYLLTKYYVRKSKNLIYVTNKFLQKRYPSNSQNQLGCSDVELTIDKKAIDRRIIDLLQEKKSIIKIGMIGSLNSKYKGYDTAIKALAILKQKSEVNFILELVGGGDSDYVIRLMKKYKVEDQVKMIGTLPHPKGVFNWLDSIDIYLQPSRQEGLPRALVEAMSRGCACVGSDIGGIPELIESKYIHKKNDFHKLSLLILELFHFDKRKENSVKSFQKAMDFNKNILDNKRSDFYIKSLNK
jgi:glycosyltransferase involved in cell wall biosynthesis